MSSPHALHYPDTHAPLRRLAPRPTHLVVRLACVAMALVVIVIASIQLVTWLLPAPTPLGTPVYSPSILGTPLPPSIAEEVEDARIQGYRAGHADAVDQGCKAPIALSSPLAQR